MKSESYLSLLLTLVMALSLLPAPAFAENTNSNFTVSGIETVDGGAIQKTGENAYTVTLDAEQTELKLRVSSDTVPHHYAEAVEQYNDEEDEEETGYWKNIIFGVVYKVTEKGNSAITNKEIDKKSDSGTYYSDFTINDQKLKYVDSALPKAGETITCTLLLGFWNIEEDDEPGDIGYGYGNESDKKYDKDRTQYKYTLTVQRAVGLSEIDTDAEGKSLTKNDAKTYTISVPLKTKKFDLTITPEEPDKTRVYAVNSSTETELTNKTEKGAYQYTVNLGENEYTKSLTFLCKYNGEGSAVDAEYTVNIVRSGEGTGTEDDPYLLRTAEDLLNLQQKVNGGDTCDGKYYRFANDITLPADWEPIGCLKGDLEKDDYSYGHKVGTTIFPFSGSIDGNNKLLTVPEGGKPLLGYVNGAEVKNLNIYGQKINGYGLVNDLHGVNLSGSAIVIDNVALKSGSSTLKSGLIGAEIDKHFNSYAGASAGFTVTVRNCTIEKDVVVGYDGTQSEIGSIAGRMQGTVENCVSYATVKGVHYVGGIIGTKDNALGDCTVNNCTFGGTVEASGNNAGGIVGGGYNDSSAPNGIHVGVKNCAVTKDVAVSGKENVGGILGGDEIVAQAWNSYAITDNTFLGKVKGEKNVGGIIGYYRSLNKFDNISNNIYAADCGATKGIGAVEFVDTNQYANLMKKDGATYFNTSKMEVSKEDPYTLYLYAEDGKLVKGPYVAGCWWKADHNRTDDPLGKDAVKLCRSTNESLLPDDNGAGTPGNVPATGDTGVLVWVIALPVAALAAAFVLKRKEREE